MKFNLININKSENDSRIEEDRYETRARDALASPDFAASLNPLENDPILDESKIYYENVIESFLLPGAAVLEIGAGTGDYSWKAVSKQVNMTLLDISKSALEISKLKFGNKAKYVQGDMEDLPFPNSHFDFVISAGSLSYGHYETVRNEILRVLRPNGTIIILDSLNHNLFFKLNRFRHFLQGKRTLSTIRRIPTILTIEDLRKYFQSLDVTFFGRHLILYKISRLLFGRRLAKKILYWCDIYFPNNHRSFKFVAIASKLREKP